MSTTYEDILNLFRKKLVEGDLVKINLDMGDQTPCRQGLVH